MDVRDYSFSTTVCWALLAAIAAPSLAVSKEVMIVTSGINAPDTVYLSRNSKELEHVPLDGVATWIATPVPIRLETGEMVTPRLLGGRMSRIATGEDPAEVGQTIVHPIRIPYSYVAPAINDLKSAVFKKLKSNFISVITGNTLHPVNWFDDRWWEIVCHNISMIALAAKEGGCRGILLDPEVYGNRYWWGHDQLRHLDDSADVLREVYKDKSWEQMEGQVRKRGRQFAQAICGKFEDPVIMFFTATGYTARQVNDPRWDTHKTAPYGLMVPFVDGILEGSSDGTIFVDCNSDMKGRSQRPQFEQVRTYVKEDGLSFSVVPDLYKKKVRVGFTFRLGYHPREEEISGENRISGLFDSAWPDANFYSPDRLEAALKMALQLGDGYILFWNYRANWWLHSVTDRPEDSAPINPMSRWVPPVYWWAIERARASVTQESN